MCKNEMYKTGLVTPCCKLKLPFEPDLAEEVICPCGEKWETEKLIEYNNMIGGGK